MQSIENIINNNAITALAKKAPPRVLEAIKTASRRTGVDFAYLLEKAAAESSFDAKAKAKTSSASGLYQFIEKTWMQMVKNHGDKYGLGRYAAAIDDSGRVADPALRREILSLRNDPEKSALLAAEFASDNAKHLRGNLGAEYGEIGSTELYFAHFMGAAGATSFLKAYKKNPLATAADLFPKAANANRNVFYDQKTGKARSLAGVYDFFDRKFGGGAVSAPANDIARTAVPARAYAADMMEGTQRAALRLLGGDYMRPSTPRSLFTMGPEELMILSRLEALPESR